MSANGHHSPSAEELEFVQVITDFLPRIKDLTPGKKLEAKLNTEYGGDSEFYQTLERLAFRGLNDGWLANIEVDGPHYRRSRLRAPSEELSWFSITAVYMQSKTNSVLQGQYHAHPYGEVNMFFPEPGSGEKPELEGLDNFWVGRGWTSPGPGSHHFPRVRNGAGIALFFLPAGRISYNAKPGMPQPTDVGSGLGFHDD